MWRASLALIAVLIGLTILVPGVTASRDNDVALTSPGDIIPGRYIVLLLPGRDPDTVAGALGRQYGFSADIIYRHAVQGFVANLSDAAIQALQHNPNVLLIEPDSFVTALDQTLPTGVDRIDGAQNTTADINGDGGDLEIDVVVIDTGVESSHPDLRVVGGMASYFIRLFGPFGTCGNSDSWEDTNGHGTHVAGTIGARDNDLGAVGVAPGARIWSVRVLGADGSGCNSDVIAGVDWVTGRKAEFNDGPGDGDSGIDIAVANMSLGGGNSSALCTAISNSVAVGVIYPVAAGNSATDAANTSPANCSSAITVSAVADFNGQPGGGAAATCRSDVDDTFADFSNFGAVVDIAAPGVCILSTWIGGGYATASGTSMATPHVAGGVALFRVATGYSGSASGPDVVAAMTAAGWTVPQNSACGFTGDPDSFAEPLIWLGAPCVTGPDTTPPASAITSPSDGDSIAGDSYTITGTTSDNPGGSGVSQVEVSTDGGSSWSAATGTSSWSFTWSLPADGTYTIMSRATDASGNVEAPAAGVTVTVDNTPPDTVITSAPSDPSDSSTATFHFTSSEADSSFECSLDGSPYTNCASPKAYSGLSNGEHTFAVRATDVAGNTDPTPASHTWQVNAAVASGGMYVWDIAFSTARGGKDLKITVTVRRDSDKDGIAESADAVVSGASVSFHLAHDTNTNGTFSEDECLLGGLLGGDRCWVGTGTTTNKGQVTFTLSSAPQGNYEARVTNITHDSYSYTSELDQDNPAYFTK